jgi:hypothetical protein
VRDRDGQLGRMILLTLVVAVLAPFLLVGCGGEAESNGSADGGGSKSSGQQALCDSLTTLNTALAQLKSLDPATATTADINAAAAQVRSAYKAVDASAQAISSSQVSQVNVSAARLVTAVKNVPPGTSAKDELKMVQPALEATQTQFKSTYNSLACGSG